MGDSYATIKLKEEIIKRVHSNYFPIIKFLIDERYLNYLNLFELKNLIHEAFREGNFLLLYHLSKRGYFKEFSSIEVKSLFSKYYNMMLTEPDKDVKESGSKLFQSIAIEQIKSQFP